MDAATAYFLKKYYPHVIKWWLVVYNPDVVRIWPSKKEKEEALRLEALEEKEIKKIETKKTAPLALEDSMYNMGYIEQSAYNATTGSYSGLYGQKPVDEDTQAALEAIMNKSSNQSSIDLLIAAGRPGDDVITPPEQEKIVHEANEIYARLLQEAAEDEAKKQAEIDEVRRQADLKFTEQKMQA